MRVIGLGAVSALALAFASPALAQPQPTAGNLEKLGNFQQTGTVEPAGFEPAADIVVVGQTVVSPSRR